MKEISWGMIQNLIDTLFHLDYNKNHQQVYLGINERKQYTLCMANSPGIYLSCRHIYSKTQYLKFALGFYPQETSLTEKALFIGLMEQISS